MQALMAVRPPCWDPLFLVGFTLTSCPQVPLDERIIFSGNLFQYQEDNKKWRNRFSLVPHNYGLVLYENKVVSESGLPLAASHRPLHLPPSYSVTPIPNLRLQTPCFPHSRLPPVFLHDFPGLKQTSRAFSTSPDLFALGLFFSMSFTFCPGVHVINPSCPLVMPKPHQIPCSTQSLPSACLGLLCG